MGLLLPELDRWALFQSVGGFYEVLSCLMITVKHLLSVTQTDKPAHIPALRLIAHTQPMLRHLSHQNKPSNPQTHRKPSGLCVVLHLWLFIAEAIVTILCNGNIQNALTV